MQLHGIDLDQLNSTCLPLAAQPSGERPRHGRGEASANTCIAHWQLPGSPSYLRPGTPAIAKFLIDLGYNTGEFGNNPPG